MPYSIDLRQRVVDAYLDGNESYAQVGRRFTVGEATVDRWVNSYRKTGRLEPLPHGGGPDPLIDEKGLSLVSDIASRKPDANRDEIARAYEEETGVLPSVATVGRVLRQLGLTRKKRRFTRASAKPQKSK